VNKVGGLKLVDFFFGIEFPFDISHWRRAISIISAAFSFPERDARC
jgi:hypothetical protein